MEKAELCNMADELINNYEENILPVIKSNVAYAPSDVAYISEHVGNLMIMMLYFDVIKNRDEKEEWYLQNLKKQKYEIKEILKRKDFELDALQEAEEDPFEMDENDIGLKEDEFCS